MGYHGTGVNYCGRELDELREPVVHGQGPSGLSQSQQQWQDIADQLRRIGMYVESSMSKNSAAHEGAAADAENTRGLSPLACYAQAAEIQAQFAAEATGNQAEYYTCTRDGMPDHMERPSLWPDILTPWEYFRKKHEYDRRVDRATDLMNSYQANSNSNICGMPEFTRPQSADIGMAIPSGCQVNPGSTSTTAPTLAAGVGPGPGVDTGSGVGPGGHAAVPASPSSVGSAGSVTGGGMGVGGPGHGPAGTGAASGGAAGPAPGGYGGGIGAPGYVGISGGGGTGTGGGTARPATGVPGGGDIDRPGTGWSGVGGAGGTGRGAGDIAGEHGVADRSDGSGGLRGGAPTDAGAFVPTGAGTRGDEDPEPRTSENLVETENIFRDGSMVAPPVIGEDLPEYYHR
jgi:hypothetical protein